jgi:acyl-coenzyme A synthetase/AMP-(fatty) acid ligase
MTGHDGPKYAGEDPRESAPGAPWTILLGSGTTGEAKKMAVSHAVELETLVGRAESFGFSPGEVFCHFTGYAFVGARRSALAALHAGATVLIPEGDTRRRIGLVRTEDMSVMSAPVVMLEGLLEIARQSSGRMFPRLRLLQAGASVISERLRRAVMARLSPNLRIYYGTNEFTPICALQYPCDNPVEGSVGRPGSSG